MSDLKSYRVLVTPTSYAKYDRALITTLEAQVGEVITNRLGRPLTSDEVREQLAGVHGYIAGLDVIDAAALAHADSLRVISRYGVGMERVDLAAASEKSIVVTNTPAANATAVAELTIAFMLSLARQIPQLVRSLKQGQWTRANGVSLEGKIIGLLGFGAIGRTVAQRLNGWGCTLMASDPFSTATVMESYGVVPADQTTLLEKCDFVSLHLPVTDATKHLVNANFLAKMKRGSYLVNTARGELVDAAALLDALNSGQVAGAALDAFEEEPPIQGDALVAHPNVIGTPHIGANTDGAANRMGWMALNDCLAVLAGKPPLYRVT
jgi:phosphoglycerate dehydrogenase-like enzyme